MKKVISTLIMLSLLAPFAQEAVCKEKKEIKKKDVKQIIGKEETKKSTGKKVIKKAKEEPANEAIAIIKKMEEKASTDASRSEISMLTYPYADDDEDFREMKVIAYSKGEDNSYMEFVSPRSIKGMCMLSLDGDQWVYFPSTSRVRKIAGKSKKKTVKGVGGDFTYEDMGGGGDFEEKYDLKLVMIKEKEWVIEGIPKEDSSCSKVLLYVDKEYNMIRVEYYTEDDGHLKTLSQYDIKDYDGREMPSKMVMENHIKETKTVILIHKAEYDIKIDKKYFSPTRFYK